MDRFPKASWRSPGRWAPALALGALLALAGCASTRVAHFGPLPSRDHLVTLIVTQDQRVVSRECGASAEAPVLGCHSSRVVFLPGGASARTVKIVRFTDVLPSEMAFEIDAHELCHAVAALQSIEDPCHHGNDGVLRSYANRRPARW